MERVRQYLPAALIGAGLPALFVWAGTLAPGQAGTAWLVAATVIGLVFLGGLLYAAYRLGPGSPARIDPIVHRDREPAGRR